MKKSPLIPSDVLNLNQLEDDLDEVYSQDFYWYLKCKEFQDSFLKPLATYINSLNQAVLDIGCGEGQLLPFIKVGYRGIDASRYAILSAISRTDMAGLFEQARLENYCLSGYYRYLPFREFPTLLFGNVLEVIIKADKRRELIDYYISKFSSNHVVVYDMEHFDHESLKLGKPVFEHHAVANITLEPEVKKHRKILAWKV